MNECKTRKEQIHPHVWRLLRSEETTSDGKEYPNLFYCTFCLKTTTVNET